MPITCIAIIVFTIDSKSILVVLVNNLSDRQGLLWFNTSIVVDANEQQAWHIAGACLPMVCNVCVTSGRFVAWFAVHVRRVCVLLDPFVDLNCNNYQHQCTPGTILWCMDRFVACFVLLV